MSIISGSKTIHLVVSGAELLAIVNALAFYDYRHNQTYQLSSDDDEQFEMAYNSESVNVDSLATKIAKA